MTESNYVPPSGDEPEPVEPQPNQAADYGASVLGPDGKPLGYIDPEKLAKNRIEHPSQSLPKPPRETLEKPERQPMSDGAKGCLIGCAFIVLIIIIGWISLVSAWNNALHQHF